MKNIKIRAAVLIILSLTMGLLTGCGSPKENTTVKNDGSSSTDGLVIRVADFQIAPYNDQLKIAVANGYFEDEFAKDNISVDVSNFANDQL